VSANKPFGLNQSKPADRPFGLSLSKPVDRPFGLSLSKPVSRTSTSLSWAWSKGSVRTVTMACRTLRAHAGADVLDESFP